MLSGAGLGFRREMLNDVLQHGVPSQVQFLEVAPENWLPFGGKLGNAFSELTAKYPFICHGLSLSIGGTAPLDIEFLQQLKQFFDQHNIDIYSEHLSYCSDTGHMYDLMPLPFTEEAARYVAKRVKQVEEIIERPLILENVSYYTPLSSELTEIEFTNLVLDEADCGLLLDVNNIYVNSVNHGYDAEAFLQALPSNRIVYGHIAGHYDEAEDLIVDTHGADVIDPVWTLLAKAYQIHGVFPTLLERDFNIPQMSELMLEIDKIKQIQQQAGNNSVQVSA